MMSKNKGKPYQQESQFDLRIKWLSANIYLTYRSACKNNFLAS